MSLSIKKSPPFLHIKLNAFECRSSFRLSGFENNVYVLIPLSALVSIHLFVVPLQKADFFYRLKC